MMFGRFLLFVFNTVAFFVALGVVVSLLAVLVVVAKDAFGW